MSLDHLGWMSNITVARNQAGSSDGVGMIKTIERMSKMHKVAKELVKEAKILQAQLQPGQKINAPQPPSGSHVERLDQERKASGGPGGSGGGGGGGGGRGPGLG